MIPALLILLGLVGLRWEASSAPPPNDTCADAIPVALNISIQGTTAGANNHYQLTGESCFQDVVPRDLEASGPEVVYLFTAPEEGLYNFKAYNFGLLGDLVVYVASECPTGLYPVAVSTCLDAADRNPASTAEVVTCVPLAAQQQVFVFIDEQFESGGSSFTLEVTNCQMESEPNDTLETASPWRCGLTGSINPSRDVDYFNLGAPPVGARIFALLDGEASSLTDFNLRVIAGTNTLEFDSDNNDSPFAESSPNIAGTPANGEPLSLQVLFDSSGIVGPYYLYTVTQPPYEYAIPETEPNDTLVTANQSEPNYFRGTLKGDAPSADLDVFAFTAEEGDVIYLGLDGDPSRDNTPLNARLELLNESGNIMSSVNDAAFQSSTATQPGNPFATGPYSPAESLVYRTMMAGTYFARVSIGSGSIGPSGSGDYLLSIAKNCIAGKLGVNTPPAVTGLSTVTPVLSGENAALTGMIADSDLGQTHWLEIYWGDGSAVERINLFSGETEFVVNHDYGSLPPGVTVTNYLVRVDIHDNLGGSTQSTLVIPMHRLISARFVSMEQTGPETFLMQLKGSPSVTYRIQFSETLPGWTELGTVTADENGMMQFEDRTVPLPRTKLYRAVAP